MSISIKFGKHKGKTVEEVASFAPDYLGWLLDSEDPARPMWEPLKTEIEKVLNEGSTTNTGTPPATKPGPTNQTTQTREQDIHWQGAIKNAIEMVKMVPQADLATESGIRTGVEVWANWFYKLVENPPKGV